MSFLPLIMRPVGGRRRKGVEWRKRGTGDGGRGGVNHLAAWLGDTVGL